MEKTKCKRCEAEIMFIKTLKGKFMPVDSQEVTIVTKKGETIRGFTPHWATCPFADKFKK